MTEQERLAAFERMYAGVLAERKEVLERLDALRAAGGQKGATYKQLLAQKLTLQNLLGRFEAYGIRPE